MVLRGSRVAMSLPVILSAKVGKRETKRKQEVMKTQAGGFRKIICAPSVTTQKSLHSEGPLRSFSPQLRATKEGGIAKVLRDIIHPKEKVAKMMGRLNATTKQRRERKRCLAVLPRLTSTPLLVKHRPRRHIMVAKPPRPARIIPLQHLLPSAKVRKKERNSP